MEQRESLILLIDVNPVAWSQMKQITIDSFFKQLFVYIKQMILADLFLPPPIIAYNQCGAEFLFPNPDITERVMNGNYQPTSSCQIQDYFNEILNNLERFNSDCVGKKRFLATRIDLALSRALCFFNNWTDSTKRSKAKKDEDQDEANKESKPPSRILVLSVSEDKGAQFDNVIFTAKRFGITIDTLFLNNHQLCFLKQAADMTGGFSKCLEIPSCFIQYLFSLPSMHVRKFLNLPPNEQMEYFAPATDTKNMICNGFLCPICLSIYEKQTGECKVCGTKSPTFLLTKFSKFSREKLDEIYK